MRWISSALRYSSTLIDASFTEPSCTWGLYSAVLVDRSSASSFKNPVFLKQLVFVSLVTIFMHHWPCSQPDLSWFLSLFLVSCYQIIYEGLFVMSLEWPDDPLVKRLKGTWGTSTNKWVNKKSYCWLVVHPQNAMDEELTNIKVKFLPKNTTSVLQRERKVIQLLNVLVYFTPILLRSNSLKLLGMTAFLMIRGDNFSPVNEAQNTTETLSFELFTPLVFAWLHNVQFGMSL